MEKNLNMTYNSQRDLMVIPEFGRNIQNLISYCKTVTDKEQRQKYAERIIHLMLQMNPQSKNIAEYKEKLWTQFFIIADFDIDVLPPNGVIPTRDVLDKKPKALGYPESRKRFRHYGNNVKIMIKKAMEMEDGPIKEGFILTIGSFMKLAFKTWNRDYHVADDVIKADFAKISEGKLLIPDHLVLNALDNSSSYRADANPKTFKRRKSNHSKNYKRNNRKKK